MATTLSSLQALINYPISQSAIESMADARGLSLTEECTPEVRKSREYRLTCADIWMYVHLSPNISQGGISYSFTAQERKAFFNMAMAVYNELDEDSANANSIQYGYKGSSL